MNNEVVISVVIALGIWGLMYFLYINGWVLIRNTRTFKYIGFNNKNLFGASISRCTGTIKRAVPIKEYKKYTFNLDTNLSEGIITVDILNSKKQNLLHLSNMNLCDSISIDKKERIYKKVTLEKVSGKYSVSWK